MSFNKTALCISLFISVVQYVPFDILYQSIDLWKPMFPTWSICRFCTRDNLDFQSKDVSLGTFKCRTREIHNAHVHSALKNATICQGAKTYVFKEHITYFQVSMDFPPDIVHDLFKDVLIELVCCLCESFSHLMD